MFVWGRAFARNVNVATFFKERQQMRRIGSISAPQEEIRNTERPMPQPSDGLTLRGNVKDRKLYE